MKYLFCFLLSLLVLSCELKVAVSDEDNPAESGAQETSFPLIVTEAPSDIPAFPGVEGFGRYTSGGRGGEVVYVTNTNPTGPGSFGYALSHASMYKKRYILFKVSGHINANGLIRYGHFTLAGQTSPGGVVVQGITSSPVSLADDLDDIIVRHMRSRVCEDGMRLDQNRYVVVDHCSFSNPNDEVFQFSRANHVTLQNNIFAETNSACGGMLVTYSQKEYPLTNYSIHHNLWYNLQGRVPAIGYQRDYSIGKIYNVEFSNNMIWNPGMLMDIASMVYSKPHVKFDYKINLVGNYTHALPPGRRTEGKYPGAMLSTGCMGNGKSEVFLGGNKMNGYPGRSDYQLMGNMDFDLYNSYHLNHTTVPVVQAAYPQTLILAERHPYPAITYTPAEEMRLYALNTIGAFPRDPQDRKYMENLFNGTIDTDKEHYKNISFNTDWTVMPLPPLDSDDDGMPDFWELHNGLDPLRQDQGEKTLSLQYTGITGYDNLEVYLNRLSDKLVAEGDLNPGNEIDLVLGSPAVYPLTITPSQGSLSASPGESIQLGFTLPQGVEPVKVEIALDQLSAPFAVGIPSLDLTGQGVNNGWTYQYTVPAGSTPGSYTVLVHAEDRNGNNGYLLIPVTITAGN